jgi:hypothetical protein
MNVLSPFLQVSHIQTWQVLILMTLSYQRVLLEWEMHGISLTYTSQLPTLFSTPLLETWIRSLILLNALHLLRIYQSFSTMALILNLHYLLSLLLHQFLLRLHQLTL